MTDAPLLQALVVDDEEPAREELAYLLGGDPRIARVETAPDGAEALRLLQSDGFDVVFLDIRMPGLDGMDLARVLRRFAAPPAIVFVTAYEDHAVDAFGLRAVDYLLKPVRDERLADAVGRVAELHAAGGASSASDRVTTEARPDEPVLEPLDDETIAVELGGVARFVRRSDVLYVEAHGDYARLVTRDGRHLVRVPLSVLEDSWAAAGFVRIHRRWLVALGAIEEVRFDGGRMSVVVNGTGLEVSRRHTRELRERLVRSARPGRPG